MVLAIAMAALPTMAGAQDSRDLNFDLEVDEDDLLELESFKNDSPLKVLGVGEEAEATEEAIEEGSEDVGEDGNAAALRRRQPPWR